MPAPGLFVELETAAEAPPTDFGEADGIVMPAPGPDAPPLSWPDGQDRRVAWVLRGADPAVLPEWRVRPGVVWVGEGGLDAVLRRRDAWPDLAWVPRLEVYRPAVRFDFARAQHGEGFSVYRPDMAAIRGYRAVGEGEWSIEQTLRRAAEHGLRTVWLHGLEAAMRGRGLDLDLLERGRRALRGRIWLSGGAAEPRHLLNLAAQGGASAAVVLAGVTQGCGCSALRAALLQGAALREPKVPPARTVAATTGTRR